MKKLLAIILLSLLCNVAFSQNSSDIKADDEKYNEALSLINTATKYSNKYDFKKALKYYMQALEIQKNILGEDNLEYATTLNNIGYVYSSKGNHKSALEYYTRALEIRRKVLGEENLDYASSLNNIGTEYYYLEDFQNSLKYHIQAIEIRKKILGEENPVYATTLDDIGRAYSNIGDHKTAMKYYTRAMEIKKNVLNENHPEFAISLNNIGLEYSYMGENQTALEYCNKALEIQEKTIGKKNMQYALTQLNIATIYYNMCGVIYANSKSSDSIWNPLTRSVINGSIKNNMTKSAKFFRSAKAKIKKNLGKNHPEYAKYLHFMGSSACFYIPHGGFNYDPDQFDNSSTLLLWGRPSINNALKIREKILGKEHSDYAKSLQVSSLLELHANDHGLHIIDPFGIKLDYYEKAIEKNYLATAIFKKKLIRNFSFMTTNEREKYWETNKIYFVQNLASLYYLHTCSIHIKLCFETDLISKSFPYSPAISDYSLKNYHLATKAGYDTELITKGLLLASEVSMTNVIMESGDSSLISEYETMKGLQKLLNEELEKPIEDRTLNCDSLENEIQKKERHIIENCKEFGDITHFIKIDWKEVQNSLKDNDVAIEFSNFTDNNITRYMAFVLTKNMVAPVCVQLFEQSEMKKLIRGIAPTKINTQNEDDRGAHTVSSAKRQGIYETTWLYDMLWKPLEKYFPKNPRIYFAPSGMLHQIAIEYAPIENDLLISDKYEMYRVSSTRFLAMDYDTKPLKNSVLYGGVYYDSDTTTMKQESERFTMRSTGEVYMSFASLNKDEARSSLPYLQGTQTEVENIAEEMRGKNISTTLYEGSAANEESFKALSGKNIDVLHIATHGFFLSTEEKLSGDQSLIQSGLMLSGANYAWQNKPIPEGVEDGILTAKEISFMDLRKTDLVVLSACQTALGEITGEGVFGLQRGFKKAGARTIIMSLWHVNDDATQLMMTEFYSNLISGMSKREAFLAAQNKVKTTKGFEKSKYWAAFIMLDGNEK